MNVKGGVVCFLAAASTVTLLGNTVAGSGFTGAGSAFRVPRSGFTAAGSGFRVQRSGFTNPAPGTRNSAPAPVNPEPGTLNPEPAKALVTRYCVTCHNDR